MSWCISDSPELVAILSEMVCPYSNASLLEAALVKWLDANETPNNRPQLKLQLGYPVPKGLSAAWTETLHSKLPGVDIDISFKIRSHVVTRNLKPIPRVKNLIAVASGKGGVGKSTVAVNLALALQQRGAKVGLLDADIYGPSQPKMLGISMQATVNDAKKLVPIEQYSLKTMSIGYLIDKDAPAIWRGPMVSQALQQLLFETTWGDLDYLILDLPPGTGDTQLTMAQKFPLTGALIVTTPQMVAVSAAIKGLKMFEKVEVPVLGIIENMSYHRCTNCGHSESIFGQDGGAEMQDEFEIPLLGQIPLDAQIGKDVENGKPTMAAMPEGELSSIYDAIALRAVARLALQEVNQTAAIPVVMV